jgi:hypothetical protein
MKRRVSKAEVKARLARRAERASRQLTKDTSLRESGLLITPSTFGNSYRDAKAARRWEVGRSSRRAARAGSQLARLNRAHDERILRDGADLHWLKALDRARKA